MPHAGMRLHTGIHQWLRVTRLVALVVTQSTETDKIEHHVLIKLPAIIERDLHHAIGGLGCVSVDMKDRRLRYLRGVSRVDRAAARSEEHTSELQSRLHLV